MDQIAKIRAVLLYILKEIPSGADYIKIFKILYFAQQAHLVTYGSVIIEDSFRALRRGPVPSFLYKALQYCVDGSSESKEIKFCIEGVSVSNRDTLPLFSATEKPDMDELSISDIECLNKSIMDYKDVDSDMLSEKSHEDKAWINANKRYNEDPGFKGLITPIEIAKAGGALKGVIDYIREDQLIDRAFCCNE